MSLAPITLAARENSISFRDMICALTCLAMPTQDVRQMANIIEHKVLPKIIKISTTYNKVGTE